MSKFADRSGPVGKLQCRTSHSYYQSTSNIAESVLLYCTTSNDREVYFAHNKNRVNNPSIENDVHNNDLPNKIRQI